MARGLASAATQAVRVAVFSRDPAQLEAARAAGADLVGGAELIEQIKAGKIDFERALATPDAMPLLAQVARVLGPKGLMPNPKRGTVVADVAPAVREAKAGQFEFKAEKAGVVHGPFGRLSFGAHKLRDNLDTFISAVLAKRPEQFRSKPPKVRPRAPPRAAPCRGRCLPPLARLTLVCARPRCRARRRVLAEHRHQLDDGQGRLHRPCALLSCC